MGSSAQLYNLGWSEFESSLKCAVRGLHSSGDLVDVTLVAGGKTFPAHKLVLSAASPLLLQLLKVTPCQHPVILLAGVSADDLGSLLEFVYSGEVNVHPSQLPSLLQAAHILNIFGLVQGTITAEKPESQSVADAAMEASTAASQKLNLTSLASATNAGLVAAMNCGAGLRRKRRAKHKESESSDGDVQDKWAKYDSYDDDTSETESCPRTLQSSATRTTPTTSSLAHTIQHVVQSNNTSPSLPLNPPSSAVKSALIKMENGFLVGHSAAQSSSDTARSDTHDRTVVLPHLLNLREEDENEVHCGNDSYVAIAAAADAAALAASTLADKKGISEQPAACPLCNAIIRQSRNLRRHLELKHFGRKPKKGKGGKRRPHLNQGDTDTESNAGSVADTSVIEHVQVEMKSPSLCETVVSAVALPPSDSNSPAPSPTPPPKHDILTELQPSNQHQNVEAFLQQQQQLQQLQIDQFPHHMAPPPSSASYQLPYPHPHPHLSMLRGDPHAPLLTAESLAYRSHTTSQAFPSLYGESSRSSTHQ